MHSINKNKILKALFTASFASIFLLGCDDKKKKSSTIKVPVQQYKQDKTLTGSIVDKEGAIRDGLLKVTSPAGKVVATLHLKDSSHFSIEIPAGTLLPVVITVEPKGSDEILRAVVISTIVSQYDISPLTTTIADRAKELGGYTRANMVMAADNTVGVPDSNKTSTGFRGDPTKQYGGWH